MTTLDGRPGMPRAKHGRSALLTTVDPDRPADLTSDPPRDRVSEPLPAPSASREMTRIEPSVRRLDTATKGDFAHPVLPVARRDGVMRAFEGGEPDAGIEFHPQMYGIDLSLIGMQHR